MKLDIRNPFNNNVIYTAKINTSNVKTLKQKISDLDRKFEGLISLSMSEQKSNVSSFGIAHGEKYSIDINIPNSSWCGIEFRKLGTSKHKQFIFYRLGFNACTLEQAIDKAHDYFITKGGDL